MTIISRIFSWKHNLLLITYNRKRKEQNTLTYITYNEIKYDKIKKLLIAKSKSILIPYIVLCAIELIDSFLTLLYKSFYGEKNTCFILIKKIIGIIIGLRGTDWYCAFWFSYVYLLYMCSCM